jgi:hypothetical protein
VATRRSSAPYETGVLTGNATYALSCVGQNGTPVSKTIIIYVSEVPTVIPGICHLITGPTTMPVTEGFSPPYNVLSSAQEVLIRAFCNSESVDVTLGNTANTLYTYHSGYIFLDDQWTPINYTGGEKVVDMWYPGEAQLAAFPMTPFELAEKTYLLGYFCQWNGSEWQCGCSNAECASPKWNLQSFRAEVE